MIYIILDRNAAIPCRYGCQLFLDYFSDSRKAYPGRDKPLPGYYDYVGKAFTLIKTDCITASIIFILCPSCGIVIDVLPCVFIIILVADDMVVIAALPDFFGYSGIPARSCYQ